MNGFLNIFLYACLAMLLTAPARAADGFVSGAEDLPLMAGLTEDEGANLVFDKPAGRIVDAWAAGAVSRAAVAAFYAETLPELGWRRRDAASWAREGERLRIDITGVDGALTRISARERRRPEGATLWRTRE